MSVAVGIAQPRSAPSPAAEVDQHEEQRRARPCRRRRRRSGSAARRGSRRSPATNSRLSSRPATKKKIASRPSAAQVPSVRSRCSDGRADPGVAQRLVGRRPRGVRPDQGDRRGRRAAARRRRSPCAGRRRCAGPRARSRGRGGGRRVRWSRGGSGGGSAGRCRPDFPAHRGRRLPGEQLPHPCREARVAARRRRPGCARWRPRARRTPATRRRRRAGRRRCPGVTAVGQPVVRGAGEQPGHRGAGQDAGVQRRGVQHAAGGPDDGRRRPLEQLALQRGEDDVVGAAACACRSAAMLTA